MVRRLIEDDRRRFLAESRGEGSGSGKREEESESGSSSSSDGGEDDGGSDDAGLKSAERAERAALGSLLERAENPRAGGGFDPSVLEDDIDADGLTPGGEVRYLREGYSAPKAGRVRYSYGEAETLLSGRNGRGKGWWEVGNEGGRSCASIGDDDDEAAPSDRDDDDDENDDDEAADVDGGAIRLPHDARLSGRFLRPDLLPLGRFDLVVRRDLGGKARDGRRWAGDGGRLLPAALFGEWRSAASKAGDGGESAGAPGPDGGCGFDHAATVRVVAARCVIGGRGFHGDGDDNDGDGAAAAAAQTSSPTLPRLLDVLHRSTLPASSSSRALSFSSRHHRRRVDAQRAGERGRNVLLWREIVRRVAAGLDARADAAKASGEGGGGGGDGGGGGPPRPTPLAGDAAAVLRRVRRSLLLLPPPFGRAADDARKVHAQYRRVRSGAVRDLARAGLIEPGGWRGAAGADGRAGANTEEEDEEDGGSSSSSSSSPGSSSSSSGSSDGEGDDDDDSDAGSADDGNDGDGDAPPKKEEAAPLPAASLAADASADRDLPPSVPPDWTPPGGGGPDRYALVRHGGSPVDVDRALVPMVAAVLGEIGAVRAEMERARRAREALGKRKRKRMERAQGGGGGGSGLLDWENRGGGGATGGDSDEEDGGVNDIGDTEDRLFGRLRRLHRLLSSYLERSVAASLSGLLASGATIVHPLGEAACGPAATLAAVRQSYVANVAGGGPLGRVLAVEASKKLKEEGRGGGDPFGPAVGRDDFDAERFKEEYILDEDEEEDDDDDAAADGGDSDGDDPSRPHRGLNHLPCVAAELLRFGRKLWDEPRLAPFPELHLPPAVALLAVALPPDAAEIVSRPVGWNVPSSASAASSSSGAATPFDLVRGALEVLERTGRIVRRGSDDKAAGPPRGDGPSLVLSRNSAADDSSSSSSSFAVPGGRVRDDVDAAALVTAFESSAEAIEGHCVRIDPDDVAFASWRLAMRAGAALVSSGIEIGGGPRRPAEDEFHDDDDEGSSSDGGGIGGFTGCDGEGSPRRLRRKRRTRTARHFELRAKAGRAFRDLVELAERRAGMRRRRRGDGDGSDDGVVTVKSEKGRNVDVDSSAKEVDGGICSDSSGGVGNICSDSDAFEKDRENGRKSGDRSVSSGSVSTINYHFAVSSFIEWSEAVFLLLPNAPSRGGASAAAFRRIRRLHAVHTLLWARETEEDLGAADGRSEDGEESGVVRLVKGLRRSGEVSEDALLDFLAARVERRPACMSRWALLAHELADARHSLRAQARAEGKTDGVGATGRFLGWERRLVGLFQPPKAAIADRRDKFVETLHLVRRALARSESSAPDANAALDDADKRIQPSGRAGGGVGLDDLRARSDLDWIATSADDDKVLARADVGTTGGVRFVGGGRIDGEAETRGPSVEEQLPRPMREALSGGGPRGTRRPKSAAAFGPPASSSGGAAAGRTRRGLCLKALVASRLAARGGGAASASAYVAGVARFLLSGIHDASVVAGGGALDEGGDEFRALRWMRRRGIDLTRALEEPGEDDDGIVCEAARPSSGREGADLRGPSHFSALLV